MLSVTTQGCTIKLSQGKQFSCSIYHVILCFDVMQCCVASTVFGCSPGKQIRVSHVEDTHTVVL